MPKILNVVGNHLQFLKQATLNEVLGRERRRLFSCVTVNTGNPYDVMMNGAFFRGLDIDQPQYDLGPNLRSMAQILDSLQEVMKEEHPDAVLIFGDTNSAAAGAIAACYQKIPCVHLDAGERLYRRFDAPEEVNCLTADHLSSLALTSSRKALHHLSREGFGEDRARFVGDIMLDIFLDNLNDTEAKATISPADFCLEPLGYIFATFSDLENSVTETELTRLLTALDAAPLPVLLQVHSCTEKLIHILKNKSANKLHLIGPLGHFDFLRMLRSSSVVVTDSNNVSRQALFAGKGSIVTADDCNCVEAVEAGYAIAVGQHAEELTTALATFRPDPDSRAIVRHQFGEGNATNRIAKEVVEMLDTRGRRASDEGPWHRLGYHDELPTRIDRSEFSYKAYRKMVQEIRSAGYKFVGFEGVLDASPASSYCLMRHDIDFDLAAARDLAKVEADEELVATYFFIVRSDIYNVFSEEGSALVREILELGHHIGLHFDTAAYEVFCDSSSLNRAVAREADILGRWFGTPISSVSFHRPNAFILSGDPKLSAPLLHTYDQRLRDVAEYVSDSGGDWKHGPPLSRQAFRVRRPLHILIHPIWWSEAPASPFETLMRLQDKRRIQDDESFAKNCRAYRVGRLARLTDVITET